MAAFPLENIVVTLSQLHPVFFNPILPLIFNY